MMVRLLQLLGPLAEYCDDAAGARRFSGGTVIATRRLPERVYGLRDRPECQRRLQQIIHEMFGPG